MYRSVSFNKKIVCNFFTTVLLITIILFFSSCNNQNSAINKAAQSISVKSNSSTLTDEAASTAPSSSKQLTAEKSGTTMQATAGSVNNSMKLTTINLEKLSKQYNSTDGRVAMAVIIYKMDNSAVIEDLSKKSAKELFDYICELAPQASYTLEGLNKLYYLQDILASEGLYVDLQSNNVVSRATKSPDKGWIQKFESAVNSNS